MTVTLRAAVDAEKVARDALTFREWGQRLTLPQYLERERRLREHPWAQAGMVTWLLLDGARVLTSCETFRTASSVGPVDGVSFAVATVFTEPELRGRGHAAQLISRLVDRLRQEPSAQGSVLFSDVGARLYEKSGYRALPAWDWVFPPLPAAPLQHPWSLVAPPKSVAAPGQLALHPSAPQLDWHFERSRLYARFLGRPPLEHFGARTGEATLWWTPNYKADELLVLWLQAPDAAAARQLVQAAQIQAHQAGLKRVRVWETLGLGSLPQATRVPRDGELPMFVSLGPRLDGWEQVGRALWV